MTRHVQDFRRGYELAGIALDTKVGIGAMAGLVSNPAVAGGAQATPPERQAKPETNTINATRPCSAKLRAGPRWRNR